MKRLHPSGRTCASIVSVPGVHAIRGGMFCRYSPNRIVRCNAMTVQPLFEPFRHKSLVLKNAFVMDFLTRTGARHGAPEQDVASRYRRGTAHDVGLLLTERAAIDREGAAIDDRLPHFYGDRALEAWQQMHDGMLKTGSMVAPKLWHMGQVPPSSAQGARAHLCEGPSGRYGPDGEHVHGRAMDAEAIAATIAAYGRAAAAARSMGFVALEIDAAHGGLIDQFFWDKTNLRDDDYGGRSLKARSHFAQDVLRAVRAAAGQDMTVIMRLSQNKPVAPNARLASTVRDLEEWLSALVDAGADVLHCAQDHWAKPEFAGSALNFAGWAKKITDLPVITSGAVGLMPQRAQELAHLVERKGKGEFDLIALDRVLAREPNWIDTIKHGGFKKDADAAKAHVHLVV